MSLRNYCGNVGSQMPVSYGNNTISPGYEPVPFQSNSIGAIPMPSLPTGVPTGPAYGGMVPTSMMPGPQTSNQVPQTVQSPYYLAGFLNKNIGRMMRVEFLIGSSGPLVDRIGTLMEVGASYIVLKPIGSNDMLVADLYSIKFATIYR